MKMLRWIKGKTRQNHIRNVIIRDKAHITPTNTFLVKKRLPWFRRQVQRRDDKNVAKSVPNTEIEESRPRGNPKLMWMDRLEDDMKTNKIRPEWAQAERAGSNYTNVNPTQETTERREGEKKEAWELSVTSKPCHNGFHNRRQ